MRYLATLILAIFLVLPAAARAGDDVSGPGLLARLLAALASDCGSDVNGDANTINHTSYEVEDEGRVVNTGDIVINISIGDIEIGRDDDDDDQPFTWKPGNMASHWMHGGPPSHWNQDSGRFGEMDDETRRRIHSAMQEVDPELMRFMFHVGRLAHSSPEFRERLEALVAEFGD